MPGSGHFKSSYQADIAIFNTPFRRFWLIAFIAVLLILPGITSDLQLYYINHLILFSIAALMLNLLTGYAGLISLGHSAFLGIGAFTVAYLVVSFDTVPPFWITVPAAGVVGTLLGAMAGLPALRLRAVYLILSTVAIMFAVQLGLSSYQSGLGLNMLSGIPIPDAELGPLVLSRPGSPQWYYFLLAVAAAATVFSVNLVRSRVGRAWMAIRDRDIAAQAIGVNLGYYKILAFAFTSGVTAMVGGLYAYFSHLADSLEYDIWMGIFFIAMIIIGGMGSILGSFLGAIVVELLPHILDWSFEAVGVPGRLVNNFEYVEFAVFGLLIAFFLLLEPEGLVGMWRKIKNYFEIWPLKYMRAPTTTR
jgi:branched-chain amino acid transport system permease protein